MLSEKTPSPHAGNKRDAQLQHRTRGLPPLGLSRSSRGCSAGERVVLLRLGIPDTLRAFWWMNPHVGHRFFNQLKMILGKNPLYWEICSPPAHSCWEKLIGMRVSDSFWLFQALRPAESQANPLLPLPDLHHGFTPPFQAAPGWAGSGWQGEVGTCHHWF